MTRIHSIHIKLLLVLVTLTSVMSCTKSFDGMNTNPNEPTDAPATNILASSIQSSIATMFGERLGIYYLGYYAGQTSPGTNFIGISYEYRDEIVTGHWSSLFYAMNNLQKLIDQSEEQGNKNMQAVALTMKSLIGQYATDMWGAIPYSKALQAETGELSPEYDAQENVYDKILADLKTAAGLFNEGSIDQLGSGDILMNGDVNRWKRFCNSLRLRVAIRISNVATAKATTTISEVLGDASLYPTLIQDENIYLNWPGGAPYIEPWNSYLTGSGPWYAMSSKIIDEMIALDDQRLTVYAQPAADLASNPGLTKYAGLEVGRPASDFTQSGISRIGTSYGYTPNGFSPVMRYSEVCFIKAEAILRGIVSGGNAEQEYINGIRSSMKENGFDDASAYLAQPAVAFDGNNAGNLNKVYMQKWFSLFKNSMEAWSETRRTDVPLLDQVPYEYRGSHTRPAIRYPYPNEELTLNKESITPFLEGLDNNDLFWGRQLWWDTRAGVQ